MPDLLHSAMLFIPLFLVVNLIAAAPGRDDLKDAVRVGLRHSLFGTVALVVISTVLYFLMGWIIDSRPWW